MSQAVAVGLHQKLLDQLLQENEGNEGRVVSAVAEILKPYCTRIAFEPTLKNGLRPDLEITLKALPHNPLIIEVKPFGRRLKFSIFGPALRQCQDYAHEYQVFGFVGPLLADWAYPPVGDELAPCLNYASYNNVGALVIHPSPKRTHDGGYQFGSFVRAANAVVRFGVDGYGDAYSAAIQNAGHLLTAHKWKGSQKIKR